MIPKPKLHLLCQIALVSLTILNSDFANGQAVHKAIVPIDPAELIKFMPATPAGWQLRQSTAKNFFVEWLCCQATREFQRVMPPTGQSTGTPAPPQVTIVKLIDTGYFRAFNGPFENFRPGTYGAFESLVINGMKARRSKLASNREVLQVSVRGRFVISVEVQNQPPTSDQGWLKIIDFARINAIPDVGSEQLPKPILITAIDELVPANNSTSKLFWGH